MQWRVLRSERLAAARDGKRIKDALERALALDPTLQDAYFGIGLYHYYADVAPAVLEGAALAAAAARAATAPRGSQEMLQARDGGELLRGEADYQLHLVYLWYEQKADEALALLDGLRQRYPHNPLFVQAVAEMQDVYLHDHPASLATWRQMFDLARQRRLAMPEMSEARARVGMAEELDALLDTDYAVEQLRAVSDARPPAPYGLTALALLRLGEALDRLGLRDQAVAAYKSAMAAAPADDPAGCAGAGARPAAARGPTRGRPRRTACRSKGGASCSAESWPGAAASLERAGALDPADVVTRYRMGRLLLARGRSEALAAFETVLAARRRRRRRSSPRRASRRDACSKRAISRGRSSCTARGGGARRGTRDAPRRRAAARATRRQAHDTLTGASGWWLVASG